MKAKKYIKSTASLVAVKKYFNIKVIASIVASLMLLYTPVALYNYTKENGTLLYNVAEAQITSTVPIVKGEIKTQTEFEEVSSYSVNNGFEEAEKNGSLNYSGSSSDNISQNTRPSSTPTYNNQDTNQSNNTVDQVIKDLSFLKGTSITMIEGENFDPLINLGIVAYDKDGTDITNKVSIDENTVDINNEGSYYVKASVKLNDGSTLEKVFTIKVNPKKETTYEVKNFEMVENTAPKLGTARIFFDSKVSDNTISPVKATINGIEYNVNTYGKSGFGGTTRHYIDVNVGDISGEFKLNVEKIEFSNGVSVWPNKQMNVYIIKSEPVVSNFSYAEDEEGRISTTFDLKDLDNSLSNIKVSLYNEKGILVEEHKVTKKEKYNLDFSVEANGKYTLEVIGDVNLYNDLSRLNQGRIILSEDIQVSKIDKSKIEANDIELSVGEELNIGDLNILALDKNGEDISSKVEIDISKLDINNAGKYEVLLTVFNSDNIKLEKVINVTVNDDSSANTTSTSILGKTRTINNSDQITKENEKNSRSLFKSSNLVSGNEDNPIYQSVSINASISNADGSAPLGMIEVEVPTSMSFTVNKAGYFMAASNYNIVNKSSFPIEVSVVDFSEEKSTEGIIIKSGDIEQNDTRNTVNLDLTGNLKSVRLHRNINSGVKISEIKPNSSDLIILNGNAGKTSNATIDKDGVSEKFTVKFRITKK